MFEGGRAVGVALRDGRRAADGARRRAKCLTARHLHHAQAADALRHRPGRPAARLHGSPCVADLPRRGPEPAGPSRGAGDRDDQRAPTAISARTAAGACCATGCSTCCSSTGPVTTTGVEACAFFDPDGGAAGRRSSSIACRPSISTATSSERRRPTASRSLLPAAPEGARLVRLRSADPRDRRWSTAFLRRSRRPPLTIAGLRFAREVLATQPIAGHADGGDHAGRRRRPTRTSRDHCKRTVKTNYHPVGTCRMGPERRDGRARRPPAGARRRGPSGVRLSMMPTLVSGNTNAPALAIADRAVTLMMG